MDKTIKVTIAIDKKTGAITQINSDLDQVGKKAQSAGKEVESFSSKFQKLAASIGIVAALTAAFTELVSTGFEYNNTMEQQIAGLTALTVATSSNVSAMGKHLSITEKYNLANSEAVSTLKQLEKINAETPHTLDQTVQIYKAMYVSMKNAGASTEQMINLTKKISIAAGSAGIEFGQLLSGVDGLATGTVEANSDFGHFLGGLGLTNEALKESGDVVKTLEERFAQFRGADTMAVAMSNLDNAFSKLSGTMTKSGFDTTKVLVNQLANALVGVNSRLEDYLANVNRIQDIRKLTTIDDMKRELTQLEQRLIELKSHGQSTWDSLFGTKGDAVAEIKTIEASITALQKKIEAAGKSDGLVPNADPFKRFAKEIAENEEYYRKLGEKADKEAAAALYKYQEELRQKALQNDMNAFDKLLSEAEAQIDKAIQNSDNAFEKLINDASDELDKAITDGNFKPYIADIKNDMSTMLTDVSADFGQSLAQSILDGNVGEAMSTVLSSAATQSATQFSTQYLTLMTGNAAMGAMGGSIVGSLAGTAVSAIISEINNVESSTQKAREDANAALAKFADSLSKATQNLDRFGNVGTSFATQLAMIDAEIAKYENKPFSLKNMYAWQDLKSQRANLIADETASSINYSALSVDQASAYLGDFDIEAFKKIEDELNGLAIKVKLGTASLEDRNRIEEIFGSSVYQSGRDLSGLIDIVWESADSAQAASEAFGDFSQSAADMYEQLTGQTHSTTAAFQELSVAFVDSMGGLQTVLDQVASNTLEMTSAQWEMVKTVYALQDVSSNTATASSATQTNTAQIVKNTSTTGGYDAHMQEYNDRIRAEMYIARYQDKFAGISQADLEYAAAIGEIIRGASTKLPNYVGANYQYEQELNTLASSFGLDPNDYQAYVYADYQSMLMKMYSDITGYEYKDSYNMGLFSWAQEFIDSLSDVSDATEDYSSSLSTAANTFGSISDTYSSWIDQRFASDTAYSEAMLRKTMAQAAGIQQIISSGGDYTQADIDRLQTLAQQSTSYASNFLASLDPSSFEYRIEQNRLAHTFGALSRIQSANEKTINDVVAAQEATNTNQQTLIRINQQLLAAMQRMGIAIEEWAA